MAGQAFSRLSHPAGTTSLPVPVPELLLCLAGASPAQLLFLLMPVEKLGVGAAVVPGELGKGGNIRASGH